MPIVVLFYQDNGLSMTDIFLLKSVYSVAIVLMEIPSGWCADVWGRRKTLLLGSVLATAGFLVYTFAHVFWAFMLAEVILGLGHSFVSGADSALLYDSLKSDNKANRYSREEGRITSVGNFAEAFAGVLGGLLAAFSLRIPFVFQTVVAAMAVPAVLMMREPVSGQRRGAVSLRSMFQKIVKSVGDKNLRVALLLSSLTGTATLTFAWFVQPFFKAIHLPVELYGVLWTALNLSVGVSSFFAHKSEQYLSRRFLVLAIILLLTIGYVLSGLFVSSVGLAFLFLFYLVRGVATPLLKDYLNRYTDSEVRATLLSVRNFMIRVVFAVTGPVLGWLTDWAGLQVALFSAGLVYCMAAFVAVWPWIAPTAFAE